VRRREFMVVGCTAVSLLLAARALPVGTRRIGVLMPIAADDHEAPLRVAVFTQGLQDADEVIA
jgi:hypothetical protein